MLENPPPETATATNKRYVPPNQRTQRRSKPDPISRSTSDADSTRSPLIIPLNGCSQSDAFSLLRQRWDSAINASHDPSFPSHLRPIMYVGASAEIQLPHQFMTPQKHNQLDFLAHLRRAIDDKRIQDRQ